jgi:hypothetical protein
VILNLGNGWNQVVDLIARTFYSHGKRYVVVKQETVYAPNQSGRLSEENLIDNAGTVQRDIMVYFRNASASLAISVT